MKIKLMKIIIMKSKIIKNSQLSKIEIKSDQK